eukprot:4898851-Ditylum_brightwellii.AAC.1
MGGQGYIDKALTIDATVEISQYAFDLKTHKGTTNDINLPTDFAEHLGVEGFKHKENPLATV